MYLTIFLFSDRSFGMALVADGFLLAVTLVDNGGNEGTMRYDLRSADHATALTDTAAIIAALNALTNAVIRRYAIHTKYRENAFAYPAAGVELEDKASLSVSLDGVDKRANLKIPAPVIGMFAASSGPGANVVDVLDADTLTYVALFETGAEAYISDGEDVDALLSGKRISSSSNYG